MLYKATELNLSELRIIDIYSMCVKINICQHCGYHLKMGNSNRIELWMNLDPIKFHFQEEPQH